MVFGLKTGIHILVWNRVWVSRELRESMNVVIVSIPNEWERDKNIEFEMHLKKFLVGGLI